MENLELTAKELKKIAFGINLGTTSFSVACYIDYRLRVLKNEENEIIHPSYVFFNKKRQAKVGKYAKMVIDDLKPEDGVYDTKRFIGRKFDDVKIQENIPYLSYQIEAETKSNEPVIVINQTNGTVRKTPTEICSIILSKIHEDLRKRFKKLKKIKAVITVPACFSTEQRKTILKAADKAGFRVLKLLNDPTAVAFRYFYHNRRLNRSDYFMVYDLGGGSFDVAIFKMIDHQTLTTIGVSGDPFLGGHDFDNLLLRHVCHVLLEIHNIEIKGNLKLLQQMRTKCEKAKKTLSLAEETVITYEDTNAKIDIRITRTEFEEMANGLIQKTLDIVDSLFKDCHVAKGVIKELILCGDSTKMPQIRKLVSQSFNNLNLSVFNNQEQTGAKGAALQAAILSNSRRQCMSVITIVDKIPLSIGVQVKPTLMQMVLKRNCPFPIYKTIVFSSILIERNIINFDFYEGERTDCKKNRYLTSTQLHNVIPALSGNSEIILTISFDQNGILSVYATQRIKQKRRELKVVYHQTETSDAEVENTVIDAENHKEEDKQFVRFTTLKRHVLNYCHSVIDYIEKKKLVNQLQDVYEACHKAYEEANLMDVSDEDKLNDLCDNIKSTCSSIVLVRPRN